jgi:hypothetical protein
MNPMELEQLSTAEGMREVVKARWVEAQPAVVPYLDQHHSALRKLSTALDDVDPNPQTYLEQVLRAKLAERRAWLALVEVRERIGLDFDKAAPLGSGFDWPPTIGCGARPGAPRRPRLA